MASCTSTQLISGYQVVVVDNATPVSSCSSLLLNASEYSQLSHGFIDSRADAELIVGAFLVLFTVVATVSAVRRVLDSDIGSEEKH